MPMNAETKLRLAPHAVSHTLEDTLALLNANTGVYYTVDGIGIALVETCGTGTTLQQLAQQACSEYEVEEEEVLSDLIELAQDLLAEGLVVVDED